MPLDHWNRKASEFLRPYLEEATQSLSLATGFFSVQGFDAIRSYLGDIHIRLMVGFDETSRLSLSGMLVDTVMEYLRIWDAQNRRKAVESLVERLQQGRLQIVEQHESQGLEAKARSRDHAKVYIIDDRIALAGSANLTSGGLLRNTENITVVKDPDRVAYYVEKFEHYWTHQNTQDLTEALLAALLAWLRLANPFDIYLKAILALTKAEEIDPPREGYKMPVKYQLVIIERLLRQIKAHQGAMLVASTGLGKTIMATHTALRLKSEKSIHNVLVFSPVPVKPDWVQALRSAGISYEHFTRNLLDMPSSRRGEGMRQLEEALEQVDDKYLIIIDESQYFRNRKRAKDGKLRHSFRRLIEIIGDTKAKVLLLTATPYSKDVEDINHQLLLLPHTAEASYHESTGQFVFKGMMDDAISPRAWKLIDNNDFFQHFLKLPVATVISTSQVAKSFATNADAGDYLLFGQEKRWIPQVEIFKVKVPAFLEREVTYAMDNQAFLHKPKRYKDRNNQWRNSTTIVQTKAETAWMSSPAALRRVVQDAINGTDKVKFVQPENARKALLEPILKAINENIPQTDEKFQALAQLLKEYSKAEPRKIILFTERLETALYLEKALHSVLPDFKVANTVKRSGDEAELKDFEKEVLPLIKGFAPIANADKIGKEEELPDYRIFITTDAYSMGVNLQDASVVINYDLAWTPDVLIQRAGRILRLWTNPRRVSFLFFVGDFKENRIKEEQSHRVEERFVRLAERGKNASKFNDLPLIPEKDKVSYSSLGDLANAEIEDLGLVDPSDLEEFSGVSPFLLHLTTLKNFQERAEALPDDISSARSYPGKVPLLYLQLRLKQEFVHILYSVEKGQLQSIKEDDLLNLLQCETEEPTAPVDPDYLEELAQKARQAWIEGQNLLEDATTERICACLLIPQESKEGFESLFRP